MRLIVFIIAFLVASFARADPRLGGCSADGAMQLIDKDWHHMFRPDAADMRKQFPGLIDHRSLGHPQRLAAHRNNILAIIRVYTADGTDQAVIDGWKNQLRIVEECINRSSDKGGSGSSPSSKTDSANLSGSSGKEQQPQNKNEALKKNPNFDAKRGCPFVFRSSINGAHQPGSKYCAGGVIQECEQVGKDRENFIYGWVRKPGSCTEQSIGTVVKTREINLESSIRANRVYESD